MREIAVIHGPNLNLLGSREPTLYGHTSLQDMNQSLVKLADSMSLKLRLFQSNAEHELVDFIHGCADGVDAVIINPAAFTHTSVAIRDALLAVDLPFIEVHLSNVAAREPFRQQSYFSDKAVATISGMGAEGYLAALRFWATYTF
ncbi:type II 3-dehydroquinate dehydratase [Marinicella gelatinilytica]|uniref:type II 3-dehydroquinate dehydratase n=1 Tax=Marinicella gelatinilytica TaxID=2996017 RepID=UPI002260969C|nr:type II 3-dehydroquinate dehydratase [Marinicella gelatinilytica]MCX7544536.1 type II 3-dehydroquinate dehydratase [Marinicella gelatinilytica]